MKSLIAAFAFLCFFQILPSAQGAELTCFELRTYSAGEGKLEGLHARFRDHTMALFEKHGMTNIAYWVPQNNEKNQLIYLLGYPDKTARDASWKTFREDPEWIAVKAASAKEGKLVEAVENLFLHQTSYSPKLPLRGGEASHVFEMRRYTCNPGKLDLLDARFRDHTLALFEKHKISNLAYFHLDEEQAGSDVTLIYFLAHKSAESKAASFKSFREDPEWVAARAASEQHGKILIEKGVESTLLEPTDYSPVK